MSVVSIVFVVLTTAWVLLGAFAIVMIRSRPRRQPDEVRPVTVLKPLSGASPDLEANLRSFFLQDYPDFQLVFGVERADDPAIAIVDKLRRQFPTVRADLVVRTDSVARNPKISNLMKMLDVAAHDLLLISDSSVRATPRYVADLVATRLATGAGLVTNVFGGVGERSFAASLENVQLNGFVAAGSALPTLLSDAAVVGKSMFFSRRELQQIGGFERVADLLAEDFIIGKMFQHAGHSVRLGREVLQSYNGDVTLPSYFDRQLRWSMIRWRLRPLAFMLEPLTSPVAMLPFAWLLFGPLAVVWALTLIVTRDVLQWVVLRGTGSIGLPLVLSPLRELSMLAVWLVTPFVKYVTWHGHRVRLGAGTMVYQTR